MICKILIIWLSLSFSVILSPGAVTFMMLLKLFPHSLSEKEKCNRDLSMFNPCTLLEPWEESLLSLHLVMLLDINPKRVCSLTSQHLAVSHSHGSHTHLLLKLLFRVAVNL